MGGAARVVGVIASVACMAGSLLTVRVRWQGEPER